MDINDLIMSDEKWHSLTPEQRLAAIRDGELNTKQLQEILRSGSETEKDAVRSFLASRMNRPALEGLVEMLRHRSDVSLPSSRMPRMPVPPSTAEQHRYESAAELIDAMKARYEVWMSELPESEQPVIYALLANGLLVKVENLTQEGHNCIAVEGIFENGRCLIVTHQATLQLVCMVETVVEGETPRRTIGFRSWHNEEASNQAGAGA